MSERPRRMLGSVLPSPGDTLIEEQIAALRRDLMSIRPLQELGRMPQWRSAREVLERMAEINSNTITELAYSPVKNEMNMLRCWAMIKAIYDLIDVIEITEDEASRKTRAIEHRLETIERISQLPRASEVEITL